MCERAGGYTRTEKTAASISSSESSSPVFTIYSPHSQTRNVHICWIVSVKHAILYNKNVILTLRSPELSGILAVWCSILITLRQNYGCKPLLFILFVQQGFIIFGSKRSPKSALVLSPFVRLSVCASVRARFQFREAISELLVHSSEYKECTYNLCVFTNSVCIPSLLVNFPNFLAPPGA